MPKAEYRNALRSRRLISDALLELLDEKPLDKITVTDITKRADVSRGTFYLHFESVADVISRLQDDYLAQMNAYFDSLNTALTPDNVMYVTSECLKQIYHQNQARYLTLIFHRQVSFADKICRNFQNRLLASQDFPQDEKSRRDIIVRSSLFAHGVLGVFHSVSTGALDLTTEDLMAGVDSFVADIQPKKAPKGGKK